ncbi:MAG: hypothetical protein IAG13_11130 [Deltaproteobacteria bacterium]|nr:hypothetical protein [Nannocystaceae bacterium]
MRLMSILRTCALATVFAAPAACATDDPPQDEESTGADESTGDPIEPVVAWPHVACDPLVPSFCPLPFPSNVYSVEDASTPTGRRVQLEVDAMPLSLGMVRTLADPWNRADGFTPGIAMLAHFPGLLAEGLGNYPTSVSIERSLEPGCPSILLDTVTGERVPHFVDLDMSGDDDAQRMLIMHPAIRLADDRRYIVAYSGLTDAAFSPLAATPAFAALRDGTPSDEPSVEERRPLYADIFARLGEAGMVREDVQLSWDFSTASRDNQTGWLTHMRDEALAIVGDDGPEYELIGEPITDLDPDNIAFKILGEVDVPMYLDQPGPGAHLLFGDDGLPEPSGTARFEFELLIPNSALESPAGVIQYGHGLLGEKEQMESEHFRHFMNQYNYAMIGLDFIGMASDDEVHIGALIATGEFHKFAEAVDRQHQGMLNSLLATRMMKGRFASDPDYGGLIDPERLYYHGISQGGIFGATYMALTTDVERGVLGVPGMPYNLLLSRSVDFEPFFEIMRASYPDARQQMYLLDLTDMLWERTEPAGYAPYVLKDMLPGTPAHQVFINDAVGDHQVTTLGAHVMARSMGMPHLDTGVRPIWGLETVPGPVQGSAIVEYSFGLPPDPVGNSPQTECEDPHGKLRKLPEFEQQLDTFLRTGVIENFCENGLCSFSDMSGCP